jgi:AraC family transcriptional regulator
VHCLARASLPATEEMNMNFGETASNPRLLAAPSQRWVRNVIELLDEAVVQLDQHPAVHGAVVEAASLLRRQIAPEVVLPAQDSRGLLSAWQARKVRAYIEIHVAEPVQVAELAALVQLSGAHFSRTFRRTFGQSPHAFVIRRRVELAAQYILETEASLSEIALRCGFTDQPHLCRHFRQITGYTPAAFRRKPHTEGELPQEQLLQEVSLTD